MFSFVNTSSSSDTLLNKILFEKLVFSLSGMWEISALSYSLFDSGKWKCYLGGQTSHSQFPYGFNIKDKISNWLRIVINY